MSEPETQRETKPSPPANDKPKKTSVFRHPGVMGVLMIAIIAAVVIAVIWWRHSRSYEFTDDAYIDIQAQYVSPQVSGRVLHVLVSDYQDVKVGDVLVEIDPADYQTRLEQARATEAQAEAQVAQANAQEIVSEAQFRQAEANVRVAQANATNADRDFVRYTKLREQIPGAVSQQQLDTSSTQARTTADQVMVAQKSADASKAQLGYVSSQIAAAESSVKSAQAQVAQAELNLSYTKVKAEVSGRIANKVVANGNYIQPGTQIMAVVPADVYVTANFKETQLARIRRNQPVEVKVDAYPDLQLKGHVDGIQPSSGQAFSILPPQNATGNWVKIVQRVPVKIVFDGPAGDSVQRLGPGMSVEAKVNVSGSGN